MEERTRLFLCLLMSGGSFALLFALFGAITGAINWGQGRSGGTAIGLAFARMYTRIAERELSRRGEGTLVGGADGLIFGVVVGLVVGGIAAYHIPAEWLILRPVLLTVSLLAGTAIILGLFAGLVSVMGVRAILGLFAGGMCGALAGFAFAEREGLFYGCLTGAAVGTLVVRAWR